MSGESSQVVVIDSCCVFLCVYLLCFCDMNIIEEEENEDDDFDSSGTLI